MKAEKQSIEKYPFLECDENVLKLFTSILNGISAEEIP